MKVVHIYRDCLAEGGVPHQTRELITAQAELGHDILTVSMSERGTRICSFPDSVEHLRLDNAVSRRPIRDVLSSFTPDVAHVTALSIPAHELWVRELIKHRIPYVLSPHGLLEPLGMDVRFGAKRNNKARIILKHVYRSTFDRWLMHRASIVHAQSPREAELAYSEGVQRVAIVPLGIDKDWLTNDLESVRRPNTRRTFVYLGRLDIYHKGLDLMLEALDGLKTARETRFILAGSSVGDSIRALSEWIGRKGDGVVELRGPTYGSEKTLLWREADFFLNVFRYAGQSRAAGEAIGQGIPIIASRESNWGDCANEEDIGAVSELTPESLRSALERCANMNEMEYARVSDNAKKYALRNTWSEVGRKIVGVYESVL